MTKSIESNSALFIFAGVIIALCLHLNTTALNIIAALIFLIVSYYGFTSPWGFFLTAIPALFGIPPAPTHVDFGVLLVILLLFFYVISTYFEYLYKKNHIFNRGFFIGHAVLVLLVVASYAQSTSHGIFFHNWLRAITPYLVLYLCIPISLSIQDEFKCKMHWLFISFLTLAILQSLYINFIFFAKHYSSFYWLKEMDGEKIFNFDGALDVSQLLGPFKARITMEVRQATSELLPVSLVCFSAIAVFAKNKLLKAIAAFAMLITLSAILETYTRSMFLAAVLVLMLIGVVALIKGSRLFIQYISVMLILTVYLIGFIYIFDMADIWIGRFNTSVKTISANVSHVDTVPNELNNAAVELQKKDENILVRMRENKIASNIFKQHVLTGAGLGIQHKISFQTKEGEFLHQNVGYVHSIIMYWLMVGGITGLILYLSCFLVPMIMIYRMDAQFYLFKIISISTLLTLIIYANFFAVFRLITFNLILAVACGISLFLYNYFPFTKGFQNAKESI